MTKLIVSFIFATLFIALLVATLATAQSVEPIWFSPTKIGAQLIEVYPERGIWSNISTGVGSRYLSPSLVMDSKNTLWIIFGRPAFSQSPNVVWNYNPKTDLYRWVAGFADTDWHIAVPGDLRMPSPDNWPGSTNRLDYPVTMDLNDNIWFMAPQSSGELWMFNTTSNLFTRMHGLYIENSPVNAPEYGTPGQPSDDVWPGWNIGGCIVTDSRNNLWQIGGFFTPNFASNNRVWHFNTTSFQWTFIAGNATNNVPTVYGANPLYGSRGRQSCDIDDDDRIWLFGGQSNQGTFNDVWSFDTRTIQWRLERETTGNITDPLFRSYPINAAVAVSDDFDTRNNPFAPPSSTFSDRKDGTLLLIGGDSSTGIGTNDVWLFNKTLKQWKLIYGDPFGRNSIGNFSDYRTPGSIMNGRISHGATNGFNTNGDVFVLGGPKNDIWLIPQQHCLYPKGNNCSSNAQCIEEMIGYSCKCNEGFTGDGFVCVETPVNPPIADAPVTPPVIDDSQSPSISPSTSSQPSSTPHKTRVSRARIVESSLLFGVVLMTVVL